MSVRNIASRADDVQIVGHNVIPGPWEAAMIERLREHGFYRWWIDRARDIPRGMYAMAANGLAQRVTEHLGGDWHGDHGKAPGPGHSKRDRSLSIKSHETDPGDVILHSFTGDDWQPIKDELRARGILPDKKSDFKIVATYDYFDEAGKLVFQVCRLDPKDFRQRRKDASQKSGWTWKVRGCRVVPYRLTQLLKAIEAGEPVFIAEGEKDCDNLAKIGLTASCNAGGASKSGQKPKWKPEHAAFFNGADVVILPDNDDPGRAHAEAIAKSLQGIVTRIRVLELPGLSEKGDVSDWLAMGGDRHRLLALAATAPDWRPAPLANGHASATEPSDTSTSIATRKKESPRKKQDLVELVTQTEVAIAEEMVRAHRADLRYVAEMPQPWHVYDGQRWKPDRKGFAFSRARQFCMQAAEKAESPKKFDMLMSAKTVAAVDRLARNDGRLIALPEEFDTDPMVLNTPGGVLDLRTGVLRPQRANDMLSMITSVAPDPSCPTPIWDAFLKKIMREDDDLIAFLKRMSGYAITGMINAEALFFLFGDGQNGKGTFTSVLSRIMGSYYCTAPIEILIEAPFERHPADLARMKAKRLALLNETDENTFWSHGKVTMLTGGDPVPARHMRGHPFEYLPQFKLMITGNNKPSLRNVNDAIKRRFNIIPFTVKISDAERDDNLKAKLRAEYPGILHWCAEGCLEWQKDGLNPPEAVKAATGDYMRSEDHLGNWLRERCEIVGGGFESSQDLYDDWCQWATKSGLKPGTKTALTQKLLQAHKGSLEQGRGSTGARGIKGIAFNLEATAEREERDKKRREYEARRYPDN